MDDFEIEIKKDFLSEAQDMLQSCEYSFMELEKDPGNKGLIDNIFRLAHSLKGTARAVGFGQIAELTHSAENLLLEIKYDRIKAGPSVVSVLLKFNDKVQEMVLGLGADLDGTFSYVELVHEMDAIISGHENQDGRITQEVDLRTDDHLIDDLSIKNEICEELEEEKKMTLEEKEVEKIVQKNPEVKKVVRKEDETLRVSLQRLEKLNDQIGELVILQSLVESCLSKFGEGKTAMSLGKLCKEIQDLSMSLRMVQIGPTFQKLTRVVRDTSKTLGKTVDLRFLGEETEIDKTVVESLSDPLVHILRNSIDHGIESPADRLLSGKGEVGVVEVAAFHEGNFLVIQITDDGAGIDSDILIKKAKEKGIIPKHENLTSQQGIELIFHPGFSTKEEVSEVSGRGVGMDVVKTNITKLGGEIKVRSKLGSGTCFRLVLPLTLAIIEGMLIECGKETFVIPKSQVQEVIRLSPEAITQLTGRVPYLTLRDEIIPLFILEGDLSLKKEKVPEIAIIVRLGDFLFGVAISDVIKLQQVVVRPPTSELNGKKGIMGTTILSDGRPSIILDLISLYSKRVKKDLVQNFSQAV